MSKKSEILLNAKENCQKIHIILKRLFLWVFYRQSWRGPEYKELRPFWEFFQLLSFIVVPTIAIITLIAASLTYYQNKAIQEHIRHNQFDNIVCYEGTQHQVEYESFYTEVHENGSITYYDRQGKEYNLVNIPCSIEENH